MKEVVMASAKNRVLQAVGNSENSVCGTHPTFRVRIHTTCSERGSS